MANGAQNASGTPAPAASHSGGHVVSARATTIGLMAILLWSFMAGTVRIVSENFGATLGSALIYTVGGILLLMFRRPAPIREFPKKYLIIGGLLFVFYESSISLSLGLASTDASSVEVSLVNYLWPTMMVLLSAGVSHRKHAVVKVLPGAIVATAGVVLAVGGNSGLDWHAAVQHIAANPLPYALAFVGALAWSVYAVFTPAMSHGVDGTSLFFPCVAVALWIIHFASGQGWPAEPPSLVAWLFVLIAAAAIGGGYACWGYGILHVFINAFPAALTITSCVFAVMLVCQNVYHSTEMLNTACVLVTGWNYMAALKTVYAPLNTYRKTIIYGMQFIFFAAAVIFQKLLSLGSLDFGMIILVFIDRKSVV